MPALHDAPQPMSSPLTNVLAKGVWLLGMLAVIGLAIPIAIGTSYLLGLSEAIGDNAVDDMYRMMSACMIGMTFCTVFNLWLHIRLKRTGSTSRWMARGFGMMMIVVLGGALWLRALYLGIFDHLSDSGSFLGWFMFSLLFAGMLLVNGILAWRRTHRRKRRVSRSRSSAARTAVEPALASRRDSGGRRHHRQRF